ncbi:MAG: DegT/DnrJ/EryC1/StrS family aminotransferase [Bacteroidales bacterium]
MQFIDLKAQQDRIKDKIDRNIQNVLAHGNYIMGPEIKELESALANFCGVKYAVGCASGTDALLMPLMAHEVGPEMQCLPFPYIYSYRRGGATFRSNLHLC